MFNNIVNDTPFTSAEANDVFKNITGDKVAGSDVSFLSTLRALLAPRIGENKLRFKFISGQNNVSDLAKAIEPDTLSLVNVNQVFGDTDNWFESANSAFTQNGWEKYDKVDRFFHNQMHVECFINREYRSTMLCLENPTLRKIHYLQTAILVFLPWYFNKDNGVDAEEMELIKSLLDPDSSGRYETALNKIASRYKLRELRIKNLLTGFEHVEQRRRMNRAQEELDDIRREMARLESAIEDYLYKERDLQCRISGLDIAINTDSGGESELADFLIANKSVDIHSVDQRGDITIITRGYVQNFDAEAAEEYIHNHRSVLYRSPGDFSVNDIEKLLTEIFINQTLKIRFCSAYRLSTESNSDGIGGFIYPASCSEYMPNTHIDAYQCTGNYRMYINKCMRENDYIGAVENCIQSNSSLNFHDGTVINRFVTRFFRGEGGINRKCIELPDGAVVTPEEAVDYLNSVKEEEA